MVAYGKVSTVTKVNEATKQIDEVSYYNSQQKSIISHFEQQELATSRLEVSNQFFDLLEKHVKGEAIGNLKFEVCVDPKTQKIKRVVKYWTTAIKD